MQKADGGAWNAIKTKEKLRCNHAVNNFDSIAALPHLTTSSQQFWQKINQEFDNNGKMKSNFSGEQRHDERRAMWRTFNKYENNKMS